MPYFFGTYYMIVGKVKTPDGFFRELLCTRKPSIQQANLLYTLCKHVCRIIDMDDLCYQLKCSPNAVRIIATHCRKILHYDWSIDTINNQGMRLSYIGGQLADADFTYLEFNPEVLSRTRPRHTIRFRLKRVRLDLNDVDIMNLSRDIPIVKRPRARFANDDEFDMASVTVSLADKRVRARL
jgi:hypothetical protein